MTEHPLVVACERGAASVLPELLGVLRTERDRPLPRVGLRRVLSTADERLTDSEKGARGVREVHVLPPGAENLTALKAGADDRQEDDARLLEPRPLAAPSSANSANARSTRPDLKRTEDRPVAPRLARPVDPRLRIHLHELAD